MNVRELDLVVV